MRKSSNSSDDSFGYNGSNSSFVSPTGYQKLPTDDIEQKKTALLKKIKEYIQKHGKSENTTGTALISVSTQKATILKLCQTALEADVVEDKQSAYEALRLEMLNQETNGGSNYKISTGFFSKVSDTAALVNQTVSLLGIRPCVASASAGMKS